MVTDKVSEYTFMAYPRNSVKAQVFTLLDMWATTGRPYASVREIRDALGLKHTIYSLVRRWYQWYYLAERPTPQCSTYRLAPTGQQWLKRLPEWWPQIRKGVSLPEPERRAAVNELRRYVATRAKVSTWWGEAYYGGARYVCCLRAPFQSPDDISYYERLDADDVERLFGVGFIRKDGPKDAVEATESAFGIRCSTSLIRALVDAGVARYENG